jgi:osmoprotectant transport system ATP-binding protein
VEKMRTQEVDSLLITNTQGNLLGIVTAETAHTLPDKNMLVSEIMRQEFEKVTPEQSIVEILHIVNSSGLSAIPVIDEADMVQGLITKSSLLTTMSQQYLDTTGTF